MKCPEKNISNELESWISDIQEFVERKDYLEYIKSRLNLAFELGFTRGLQYSIRRREEVTKNVEL